MWVPPLRPPQPRRNPHARARLMGFALLRVASLYVQTDTRRLPTSINSALPRVLGSANRGMQSFDRTRERGDDDG